jgi:excisionase family DNA binding protein
MTAGTQGSHQETTARTQDTESFYQRLNKIRQFLAAASANCTDDEARAAFLTARRLCGSDDDPDELITVAEAARLVGAHHQTLRRWWKAGLFPAPRRLGLKKIGLWRSEVLVWIATRPLVPEQEAA